MEYFKNAETPEQRLLRLERASLELLDAMNWVPVDEDRYPALCELIADAEQSLDMQPTLMESLRRAGLL